MEVLKLEFDYTDGVVFLPIQANLEKGTGYGSSREPYENFEALKKDWESKEWGYTSKVTVTVVESYTATQIEELKAIPDLFPDMPKTEPVEITLENAEDFVVRRI